MGQGRRTRGGPDPFCVEKRTAPKGQGRRARGGPCQFCMEKTQCAKGTGPPRARRPWPILFGEPHYARGARPPRARRPWAMLCWTRRHAPGAWPPRALRPWPIVCVGNHIVREGRGRRARAAALARSARDTIMRARAHLCAGERSMRWNSLCARGSPERVRLTWPVSFGRGPILRMQQHRMPEGQSRRGPGLWLIGRRSCGGLLRVRRARRV